MTAEQPCDPTPFIDGILRGKSSREIRESTALSMAYCAKLAAGVACREKPGNQGPICCPPFSDWACCYDYCKGFGGGDGGSGGDGPIVAGGGGFYGSGGGCGSCGGGGGSGSGFVPPGGEGPMQGGGGGGNPPAPRLRGCIDDRFSDECCDASGNILPVYRSIQLAVSKACILAANCGLRSEIEECILHFCNRNKPTKRISCVCAPHQPCNNQAAQCNRAAAFYMGGAGFYACVDINECDVLHEIIHTPTCNDARGIVEACIVQAHPGHALTKEDATYSCQEKCCGPGSFLSRGLPAGVLTDICCC